MEWSFAVLGDTHMVRAESHERVLHGGIGGATELGDLQRNGGFTEHVLPRVLDAVREQQPDFVLHTGDVIPGHCDTPDGQVMEMQAALGRLKTLGVPVFFAFGSHDGALGKREDTALRQVLLPYLSQVLGVPCERSYYAFSRGGCRFVALDYTTWNEEQRRFAERELTRDSGERLVVFGHPPVVPVARPFFTNEVYAHDLAALFARCPVPVYFCGHSHNHAASLHRFGERVTAQLMSTPLADPDAVPLRLDDTRPLLPDPATDTVKWGFLEDTMPGWWRVRVTPEKLLAEWFVLGRGRQGALHLPCSGEPEFLQIPDFPTTRGALPPLSQIASVRLRLAGSGHPFAQPEHLTMNGVAVPDEVALVYFDSRQFVELPASLWPYLAEENTMTMTVSDGTIGGLVLELTLTDGRVVRSTVSPYVTTDPVCAAQNRRLFSQTDGTAVFQLRFE